MAFILYEKYSSSICTSETFISSLESNVVLCLPGFFQIRLKVIKKKINVSAGVTCHLQELRKINGQYGELMFFFCFLTTS